MTREEAKEIYDEDPQEDCIGLINIIYDDFEKELKELRFSARDKVCNCKYPIETFESIFGYSYITDEKIDLLKKDNK